MLHRLLIADDSPLYRLRLSQIFAASDCLQIVGLANDGQACIKQLTERRPDVLVLDLEMPGLDGLSVLRWAMQHRPLPIIVCSEQTDRDSVFQSLEAGAVDFITKPELRHAIRSEEFAAHLRHKVEAAVNAHTQQAATNQVRTDIDNSSTQAAMLAARLTENLAATKLTRMVGIVGSAGSPAAVNQIISRLPMHFATPVVIALHMPQGFTRSFAQRLARSTQFQVSEARHDERIAESHIYIAPGGHHTFVRANASGVLCFHIEARAENDFHAPSADYLLMSLAEATDGDAIGVVLTGMGEDGLRGARQLRARGGRIIVESRESAVIWGMPRAVSEAGLADAELDPNTIAALLPLLCANSQA